MTQYRPREQKWVTFSENERNAILLHTTPLLNFQSSSLGFPCAAAIGRVPVLKRIRAQRAF